MILAIVIGWICLFTLCQCKVITVNNEGNNTFINALKYLQDNTIVNVTLQSVTLDSNVTMGSGKMGSGNLNNVTILGNGVTVLCNYQGSVLCQSCSNIILEGITWDRCANYGIFFLYAVNITISMCTFQHFNASVTALINIQSGFVTVQKCHFLFNLGNQHCDVCTALAIVHYELANYINISISETLFYYNGIFQLSDKLYDALHIQLGGKVFKTDIIINNSTVSRSGGLGGYIQLEDAGNTTVFLSNTVFTYNNHGGFEVKIINRLPNTYNFLGIFYSTFAYNINGSLKLVIQANGTGVEITSSAIIGNKGTFDKDKDISSESSGQGTGILLWFNSFYASVKISLCNISNNVGGDSSIVYLEDNIGLMGLQISGNQISIHSTEFTNNYGSALYLAKCNVRFYGHSFFTSNSAQSGAAIYFSQNSQATVNQNSVIEFINNVALLFGGAIYVNLPFDCYYQGIVFTNLKNSLVSFINNSAGISGDSLYFSIPDSCNIVRNSSDNNSIVYTPYQFTYTQLPGSVVPEISTSPYSVNLCSTVCNSTNINYCFVENGYMLGQPIYFNATVCDYYNNVSGAVQFLMECINCNDEYKLSDNKILLHNGLSKISIFAIDAHSDIPTNKNITINMSSVFSHGYKQLSAVLSIDLSPCHAGYIFDGNTQKCKCYDHDQDIIHCQQDYAEIKDGHWFGTVSSVVHTLSRCPTYYCNFDTRTETREGYYNLPKEQNDQCNLQRRGMACGECTDGHTLAYDSSDCINVNKCSPGMTVLVVVLTILYWIAVVAVVFVLMYLKVNLSLGYVYGILFYYSIVDILLGSNLYISIGVFQLTTILSSFAKLTPRFLGKLCFVQGLSGIDQQFIHYVHALAVSILIIAIVVAARCSMKIASIVSRCIIRVICLLLLLAYTSLASTSLQLLRPLYYHDIDGAFVYLSPSIKYFTGRHVAYGIVACVCGLFIVIGFPLLLFLQPFLKSKLNFVKIKPLLDQFQGCYKDQYHWFAAYYLICRLIIIGITFASDFDNMLYYLQTASIIIVMIHVWIQPYKSDMLNALDGLILLTMILVINLGSYTFIRSTTIGLVIILVIFPLGLCAFIFFLFSSPKFFSTWKNHKECNELQDVLLRSAVLNDDLKASSDCNATAEVRTDDANVSINF